MEFSRRSEFDLRRNRLAEKIEARRATASSILDLTLSNPTQAGLTFPEEELSKALSHGENSWYQPDPLGLLSAREAICDYYKGRSIEASPSEIVLTASTSEAYSFLFKLLCNPGDEVLIPQPSYPLFEFLSTLESIEGIEYPLFYDGLWEVDICELEHRMSDRARAILLVNPNNPTGSYLHSETAGKLFGICGSKGLPLICDEVFFDYPLDKEESHFSLATDRSILTFHLNGLSKLIGLPQMKLGWILVSGPPSQAKEALRRLEMISDSYLSVNTPVQNAVSQLLVKGKALQGQIHARVRKNLDHLKKQQSGSAFDLLRVEGGWYAVLRLPRTISEEEWALRLLDEESVLAHPGSFYRFSEEPFLVVSLLPESTIFQEAVTRLVRFV